MFLKEFYCVYFKAVKLIHDIPYISLFGRGGGGWGGGQFEEMSLYIIIDITSILRIPSGFHDSLLLVKEAYLSQGDFKD